MKAGLNAFAYSVEPVAQIDPNGLPIWEQAFRVAQAGIRTGKKLSEKAAKAFLRRGGDVVTNERKAAERVSRQLSQEAGGGGSCTPTESHKGGAKHVHTWSEGDDALEWINPSPYSMDQWNLDPFGVRSSTRS